MEIVKETGTQASSGFSGMEEQDEGRGLSGEKCLQTPHLHPHKVVLAETPGEALS